MKKCKYLKAAGAVIALILILSLGVVCAAEEVRTDDAGIEYAENEEESAPSIPQTGDGAVSWCLLAGVCISFMAFLLSPRKKNGYSRY